MAWLFAKFAHWGHRSSWPLPKISQRANFFTVGPNAQPPSKGGVTFSDLRFYNSTLRLTAMPSGDEVKQIERSGQRGMRQKICASQSKNQIQDFEKIASFALDFYKIS